MKKNSDDSDFVVVGGYKSNYQSRILITCHLYYQLVLKFMVGCATSKLLYPCIKSVTLNY